MAGPLQGRVALVTGAGSGIGRALAASLDQAGARVILTGRREDRLAAVAAGLARPTVAPADVCDAEAVSRLARTYPEVDLLVLAAGAATAAPVHEIDVAAFDHVVATNLRGPFLLCRAFLPTLREHPQSDVVILSSVSARRSFRGMGAYGASKAGVAALAGVLREENREHGVRVLEAVIGATDTDIWDDVWPSAPRDRMMAPASVARAVVAALSAGDDATVEEILVRPVGGDL